MNNNSDNLYHASQLPKNWIEKKVKKLYRVGFPVGLFQIVPVAWVVSNFERARYCDFLSIRDEGTYAETKKWVGTNDEEEDKKYLEGRADATCDMFEDIVYRNSGTSVTVDSPSHTTTHEYATRLLEFVMDEKRSNIRFTSKYEKAVKEGKCIAWQYYKGNDSENWVIILPMNETQTKKFLNLSTSANYVLEPLHYELTGFAALRADSADIAKAQGLEVLNWLYKVRKPEAINPDALPERTIDMDYETYPTRNAALLALFKATNWDAGIYVSIFPTGNGRFYFTTDEKESLAIAEKLDEKGIEYYHVCDDGSDEHLEKCLNTWYKKELREEFDKVVPRTHPQYNAIWKFYFSDLASCADGEGGYGSPVGMVESCVSWLADSKSIWVEEIAKVVNSVLSGDQAKKLLKAWTKGKTVQECAGVTEKEWLSYKIYSEDDLREFAKNWAKEQLGQ